MDDQRIARLTHDLGDLDLAERVVRARRELVVTVPEPVARAHLQAIEVAAAEPSRRPAPTRSHPLRPEGRGSHPGGGLVQRTVRLATAATVVALATIGGLAVAGSLPASAQNLVADAVARVGVDLPRAGPPAGPPTDHPSRTGEVPSDRSDAPGAERRDDNPGVEPREQGPGAGARDQTRGSSRDGLSPPPDDRRTPARDAPRHTGRPATSGPPPADPSPAWPPTTSPPATSQERTPAPGGAPGASSAARSSDEPPRRSEPPAPRSGRPGGEPATND